MLTSFTPSVGTELFDNKGMLMAVITASGIVVVFAILILLIFIFYAYGAAFRAVTEAGERKKAKAAEAAASAQTAVITETPAATEAPAPLADGEIPGEIIAVIAAAVASLGDGKAYRVKKVVRSRTPAAGRTPWATSGLFENTRPF